MRSKFQSSTCALAAFLTLVAAGRAQFTGGWSTLTTMPVALSQTAAAVVDQNQLWVIGGWAGGSVSNAVQIYNATTNSWSTGPSLPTAVRDASAVYYNNQIIVFGGYTGGSQSGIVQVYDLGTSSWSSASFSSGGWAMASTVVGNQILTFAGEASSTAAALFNPVTQTFTALAPVPFLSIGGQAGALGNQAYFVGGGLNGYGAGTEFAVYNPALNSWSTSIAQLPAARTQFAAASNGQFFYVAGGGADDSNDSFPIYNTVYAYNPGTNTWLTGPSLPADVREASGVMLGNEFLVIGGFASTDGSTGGISNAIYALQTIPEPPAYALLALGLMLLGIRPRRRKLA